MKCELFSVKNNPQEVERLDSSTSKLMTALSERGISLLYKTEISPNPVSIETALKSVASSNDAPELIIIANALGSDARASFVSLFERAVANADNEQGEETVIRTLSDLGNGIPGFFFIYHGINITVLPQTSICGRDITTLTLNALNKIQKYIEVPSAEVQNDDESELSDISAEVGKMTEESQAEEKPKKKGFFASVFPQRGDRAGTVISKILVLVFVAVFIVAGYLLIDDTIIKSIKYNNQKQELLNLLYNEDEEQTAPSNPYGDELDEEDQIPKKWLDLTAKYPDIRGWIRIKNLSKINDPILYSEELDGNDYYYLYHDIDGNRTKYGSLFIDPNSESDDLNTSRATVIHGHHMRDGSMFASLTEYGSYSGNLENYKKSPIVTIETPQGISKWIIFSVIKTNTNMDDSSFFNYAYPQFENDQAFMEYVYKAKVRSLFDVPININENDRLLILSTCSYEYNDYRTVVFARELRKGEYSARAVRNTTVSKNPLWPDDYYSATGLSRPKVSDFETAYKNGEITWYDGRLYQ